VRLLSYGGDGATDRLAVAISPDTVVDVADLLGERQWTMARLLDDVPRNLARLRAVLDSGPTSGGLSLATLRVLPPVPRPGKIIAVGRNYREHAAEEEVGVPEAPLLFAKLPTALIGDGATVTWSAALSMEVDYEAELAVVIGRTARNVPVEQALDYVLGYSCLNDVSARDLQVQDGQWTRAKSLDTFCPMGPWVVTVDEIADPGHLRIRCRVNGEVRQDDSTAALVRGVGELIAYCSRSFTLEPGDVIATGTPGGVGVFRDPPIFLEDGDAIEVEIDLIGTLRNRCHVLA
jgi:2-keto-4-pentenoate hydratase/2-oxohepta-3-ene-1,7-dioic acid hydratase in catechol pathway